MNIEELNLLPQPRSISFLPGTNYLTTNRLIVLEGFQPGMLLFSAAHFQSRLRDLLSLDWEITAFSGTAPTVRGLTLRLLPVLPLNDQGYHLSISGQQIQIEACTASGIFYGVATLIQILENAGGELPCLKIEDWPDFPVRGVMLDVSRDKVPTLETLFGLVDRLASWKINQIQLYTEHTFAYQGHKEVWVGSSPLTGQDILALNAYCKERFIDLVPNQNSFGHMHRWLIHEKYAHLGEVRSGFSAPWGYVDGPFSLSPANPGSLELISSLYDELLPHFSSRMINVGCDETFDLGQGQSKEEVERRGAGRVYLDFLLDIYTGIKRRGYTMQYWSDIVLQHPDLIDELPRDAIALEWGYEANHPFEEHCSKLDEAGIPFYVCPGTSSWNSISGRTDNALMNLQQSAESGLKYGACGYLITDWGDSGHWQPLSVSYLGLAAGAAYSWALDANRDLDISLAVSWHGFGDRTGAAGSSAFKLGNLYRVAGIEPINTSALFLVLQWPLYRLKKHPNIMNISFQKVLAALEDAAAPLELAQMSCPDADIIQKEYALVIRMLKHACHRGLLAQSSDPLESESIRSELKDDMHTLLSDFEQVWLARNRPGGLVDSVACLERIRQDYLPEPITPLAV